MTSARLLSCCVALLGLLLGGCIYYADPGYSDGPAYRPAPPRMPATALVIVMRDETTEAEYLNCRTQIITYLVQHGYITGEADLIANPDHAQRIIRAIVQGREFTLSVFNQDNTVAAGTPPPYLEYSDLLYPNDPYFILGFVYFDEIGPRRLPPRPPGYRPHPGPSNHRPPDHHPDYDRKRHWPDPHDKPAENRPPTPPGSPRRPPNDDHRDPPKRDDHPSNPPPGKPSPPEHRPDNRPNPDRNDQPRAPSATPPPTRASTPNNPTPNPPPPRPIERPAQPPPKPDGKEDDKRNQQER